MHDGFRLLAPRVIERLLKAIADVMDSRFVGFFSMRADSLLPVCGSVVTAARRRR
jgi:hypothetical protein